MRESYSDDDASGAADGTALARELIARLLPGTDAALLVSALVAEGATPPGGTVPAAAAASDQDAAAHELRRVRRQFVLGDAARTARHDLSNPLTALLAEAQLLELEPQSEEQRMAVGRILELARRIVAVLRRLDAAVTPSIG